MGEVIKHALVRQPERIEWDGTVETPVIATVEGVDDVGATIAH
jgi:ATP-dependent Lon protease